ncbi:hypothetical protein NEAUS05_1701 [Nematocida ausubeli]|nr:hypothetical protein NEAUS05_1701 [Nematocida ausubeli]
MEYFSSEEDRSSVDTTPQQKKKNVSTCMAICILSFALKKALSLISHVEFKPPLHESPFNTYMREKQKEKYENPNRRDKLDRLALFKDLSEAGILCRIVYKISVTDLFYEESLEILSGKAVITDSLVTKTKFIHVSVDSFGKVINHTVYTTNTINAAISTVIPRSDAKNNSYFHEHDLKTLHALPTNRQEGNTHPFYRIEPESRRYVVYPREIGHVGEIKDKTQRHTNKSKVQKKAALRIYPISHIHKLLTQNELWQRNKTVPSETVPYRIIETSGKPKIPVINSSTEGKVLLYAPWQTIDIENAQDPDSKEYRLFTLRDIPQDSIYLQETDSIKYSISGIGSIPYIGKVYNHQEKRMERVYSGILIKREEYLKQKNAIVKDIHRSLLSAILISNRKLLLNMQIITELALKYTQILEEISNK